METIRRIGEGNSDGRTVVDRLSKVEEELTMREMREQTNTEKKPLTWTGKFKRVFAKSPKSLQDKVIVLYLNAKKEMEEPVIVPIISGGIVVYRDKGYRFDPKGLYTVKIANKMNKVLILRETDRYPVGSDVEQISNEDFEELRKQGRVPLNDPILLKMLWNAQIEKQKKGLKGNYIIWIVLAIIAIIVIYMFMK